MRDILESSDLEDGPWETSQRWDHSTESAIPSPRNLGITVSWSRATRYDRRNVLGSKE